MIELLIENFLSLYLTDPIGMELPEVIPDRFILIDKMGSGCSDYIYAATVSIQSYGISKYDAARLNEVVKGLMKGITIFPEICRCKLNSDYPFDDVKNKRYRYQAVFNITHYELITQ